MGAKDKHTLDLLGMKHKVSACGLCGYKIDVDFTPKIASRGVSGNTGYYAKRVHGPPSMRKN